MKRLSLVIASLAIIASTSAQTDENQPEFRKAAEKFTALLYHLENSYVDSVELEDVVDESIREVLSELDPHSVYIPAKDVKKANEGLEGNFEGIGIQFNILKDTIIVVSPIAGGPSETLGIMAGDKIVSIEGENVAGVGITNSDVTSSLRGDKGSQVTVGIRRSGQNKVLVFDIIRDEIPLYSLDASYMATDKIGYIKINRFSKTTMDEFNAAITHRNATESEMSLLDRLIWQIESHLDEPLTLEVMADRCAVNRHHMCRAFQLATGRSIMGYVRARRSSLAAQAIAGGAPDLLQVARGDRGRGIASQQNEPAA